MESGFPSSIQHSLLLKLPDCHRLYISLNMKIILFTLSQNNDTFNFCYNLEKLMNGLWQLIFVI